MAEFLRIMAWIIGIAALLAVIGVALIYQRLKRLDVPPNASFTETMRRVPLSLAVVLDLLDLGFDFLGAPFSWWLLSRFNLQALRNVSVVEALIPGTQLIPTMTAAWFGVRWFSPAPTQTPRS